MFINKEKCVGQRLPPRTAVQCHGKTCEIVVIHIEQNNEIRGAFPKSTKDQPFATIGVFHIHPNISHGAAKEDMQKGIMPLVTEYQCDVITGDANKSANTFSKLQSVYNPENGLMNYIMEKFKKLWNETQDMPLAERMDFPMSTSSTIKAIARHHIHMKTGSGYDRTFPDCMMTFVFKTAGTNDVCFLEPFEPSMQQPVMPHACVLPAVMLLELMPNTQKETGIRKPTNMPQTYNS